MANPLPIKSGIRRYKGEWKYEQVAHLLRRTMFGAKREDVGYFLQKSPKKAVRELLRMDLPAPPPPINNYNDDKYVDPEIAPGADWAGALKSHGMGTRR